MTSCPESGFDVIRIRSAARRWNRAVIVCVDNPQEAAQRYARYTGLLAQLSGSQWRIDTQRGALLFVTPETLQRRLGLAAPSLPWIAGYVLTSDDPAATRSLLEQAQCATRPLGDNRLLLEWPGALGGFVLFQAAGTALPAFD